MKAVQYRQIGNGPELVDIDTPEPGPGQVRLKITAAGLCHSDWFKMGLPAERFAYDLPMTLGHEAAGTVDKLGEGATGVELGASYVVYGPRGCGECRACAEGAENYCPHAATLGIAPPGLGSPGAMAEYMIVDNPRHLVPLGDLDPVESAPLTDAGLTPYHAIKSTAPKLRPGTTVVVIGVGGLGHIGVQILRATTAATVIAVDVSEEKLAIARDVGAHHTIASGPDSAQRILDWTGPTRADAVFDFVGTQGTLEMAREIVAVGGDISIVGIGGGILPTGFTSTPLGVSVRAPYWGGRTELIEVLELARTKQLSVHVETFALGEAVAAYARLREGAVRGRAVVVP